MANLKLDNGDTVDVTGHSKSEVADFLSQNGVSLDSPGIRAQLDQMQDSNPTADKLKVFLESMNQKILNPNTNSIERNRLIESTKNVSKMNGAEGGSEKQNERANAMLDFISQYDNLIPKLNQIESGKGAEQLVVGPAQWLGKVLHENPEVSSYDAMSGLMASNAAKNVGSDKGALSEGDVKRAIASLSSYSDNFAERQSKLEGLISMVEGITHKPVVMKNKLENTDITSSFIDTLKNTAPYKNHFK
jgi:hypothetical protein